MNYTLIKNEKLDIENVEKNLADYMVNNFSQIAIVRIREEMQKVMAERNSDNLILNGFNFKRSGDIAFELEPNNIPDHEKGTTHGSQYNYDTHVPMIFYGWHIPALQINKPVYIVDIAPTISNLIGITEPNECIGIPIINNK